MDISPWIVVLAAFLANVVTNGVIFSYGTLLSDLNKKFADNQGLVAWGGSIITGFLLGSGPLVSPLIRR